MGRLRFDARVPKERIGIFNRVGGYSRFSQRDELPVWQVERIADLIGLVGIVGGQQHLHHAVPSYAGSSRWQTLSMGWPSTKLPNLLKSSTSSPVV